MAHILQGVMVGSAYGIVARVGTQLINGQKYGKSGTKFLKLFSFTWLSWSFDELLELEVHEFGQLLNPIL